MLHVPDTDLSFPGESHIIRDVRTVQGWLTLLPQPVLMSTTALLQCIALFLSGHGGFRARPVPVGIPIPLVLVPWPEYLVPGC